MHGRRPPFAGSKKPRRKRCAHSGRSNIISAPHRRSNAPPGSRCGHNRRRCPGWSVGPVLATAIAQITCAKYIALENAIGRSKAVAILVGKDGIGDTLLRARAAKIAVQPLS